MAMSRFEFNVDSRTKSLDRVEGEAEDWWRWNNYGIALLDNNQFPEAADAFDEVIDFKNGYRATAYTNKALALMKLGGWKEADSLVRKTLKMEPQNFRSIFQASRIRKVFSELNEAEAGFKQVLEAYPNDRDTLQQLGELAKLRSEEVDSGEKEKHLREAVGYFDRIMEIDPEDLSATYNLMILYQKLGERARSAELSKQFRDLKDDTQTAFIASSFLQKNPEVGNESLPYHFHSLELFDPGMEMMAYPSIASIDWSRVLKTTADFVEAKGR
jgi:tetratricopeptide (TPR) repeat protein